ncbi:MAG TPA: helix-turn-helix transcriptional regulator, partial [Pseudonocardia sp.]
NFVDRLPDAARLAERAYRVTPRDGGGDATLRAQLLLATMWVLIGRHDDARRCLGNWVPGPRTVVSATHVLSGEYPYVVQTLARLGRYRDAARLLELLKQACDRESVPTAKAYLLTVDAEMLIWRGRWATALAVAAQASELAELTGRTALTGFIRATTARIHASRGDAEQCREDADAALTVAHLTGIRGMRVYAHAALGLSALSAGGPEAAVAELLEADAVRRDCGLRDPATVPFAADLIEALAQAGETARARSVLAEHAGLAERSGTAWACAVMARCAALLQTNPDQADAQFAQAVRLHPPEVPFDLARTRLCWAEHRLRRGDAGGARALLSAALSVFFFLQATPWATRARAAMRACGDIPPPVAGPSLAALSAQEHNCAVAIAEGKSNRQVATALFISPKTVEYHLSKIYAKLGINSRTQLTRIVLTAQHDPSQPS